MIGCVTSTALNDGAGAHTAFCWCYLFLLWFSRAHLCSMCSCGLVQLGIVSSMQFHVSESGGSQRHRQCLITRLQLFIVVFMSSDDKSTH